MQVRKATLERPVEAREATGDEPEKANLEPSP